MPENPNQEELIQYRKGVVAILLNANQKILLCHRRDRSVLEWQLPQGGIESKETPEEACEREVFEETGIRRIEVIGKTQSWITYEWPSEARRTGSRLIGQAHIYLIARVTDESLEDLQGTQDFDRFEWVNWLDPIERVVEFKKEAYSRAFRELENFRAPNKRIKK